MREGVATPPPACADASAMMEEAPAPLVRAGASQQPKVIQLPTQKRYPANAGRAYRAYIRDDDVLRRVRETDGACRVVGRLAIEHHEMRRSFGCGRGGHRQYQRPRSGELTELRAEIPWIKEAGVHYLQQELACVAQSFENWGKHSRGYPRPRSRRDGVRLKLADPRDWRIERVAGRRWRIRLTKIGWVEFVKHRPFGGTIKSVTLTEQPGGRWQVSFGIAERNPQTTTKSRGPIGVDLGVVETVATSHPVDLGLGDGPSRLHRMPVLLTDGEQARYLRLERQASSQQRARQQRNGRAKGGPMSNRQARTYRQLAVLKARAVRRRRNWLRTVAARLGEHEYVVFEDLDVAAMTRSARGTADAPGRNVAAKSGLNRAILTNGWGYLRVFTGEQTEVVKVRAAYSSQECRACGHTGQGNRPDRDTFRCEQCQHENHADVNAAEVILTRGSRARSTSVEWGAEGCGPALTKNREARAA